MSKPTRFAHWKWLREEPKYKQIAKVEDKSMKWLKADQDEMDNCILCGEPFGIGVSGNELGFCEECQAKPDFPYDLDAYYKDYDDNKVVFKGFDTMDRGILEPYRKNKVKAAEEPVEFKDLEVGEKFRETNKWKIEDKILEKVNDHVAVVWSPKKRTEEQVVNTRRLIFPDRKVYRVEQ